MSENKTGPVRIRMGNSLGVVIVGMLLTGCADQVSQAPSLIEVFQVVLKFLSLAAQGALGLVALYGDFRDAQTQRLTKHGRWTRNTLIVFLLISVLLEAFGIYDDRKDKEEREQKSAEQSERGLSPFGDYQVTFQISAPLEQSAMRPYADRLIKGFGQGQTGFILIDPRGQSFPDFTPNEKRVREFLSYVRLDIEIYRSSESLTRGRGYNPDLFLTVGGYLSKLPIQKVGSSTGVQFGYSPLSKAVIIQVERLLPSVIFDSGAIKSWFDLDKCQILVDIQAHAPDVKIDVSLIELVDGRNHGRAVNFAPIDKENSTQLKSQIVVNGKR